MRTQTCVDVRYTTPGLCEAVSYATHPTAAVKNSAIHNHCAAVRLRLHITQQLAQPTRRYGDKQTILPLPQTAIRPS